MGAPHRRRIFPLELGSRQIKKNDRVVTIGGIVGTVATVKEDEVTLKVDESNNTKITFSRVAIQRVMSAETATTAEKPAK